MLFLPLLLIFGVAGVAAGRHAGARGWILLAVPPVVISVTGLIVDGFVDPIAFVVSLILMIFAAIGLLIGLLLRRRAQRAA